MTYTCLKVVALALSFGVLVSDGFALVVIFGVSPAIVGDAFPKRIHLFPGKSRTNASR